jgi:hypothetical protein
VAHLQALGSKGQIMWSAAFSPDGKHLALSSTTASEDVEILRAIPTSATGAMEPVELVRDAARWQIARDGKKVFYLKGYNYAERDAWPARHVDDGGLPDRRERDGAAAGRRASSSPSAKAPAPIKGLSFLRDFQNGRAVLQLQPDRTRPDRSLTLESFVDRYFVSSDRRYSYVAKLEPLMPPLGVVAKTNGGGACALSSRPGSTPYLVTFLPAAPVVLWAEDAPPASTSKAGSQPRHLRGQGDVLPPTSPTSSASATASSFAEDDGEFRSMTIRHTPPPRRPAPRRPRHPHPRRRRPEDGRHRRHATSSTRSPHLDHRREGLYAYGPLP